MATISRRINIWINGKEVRNDIASIKKEVAKLTSQRAHMVIDSDEYKKATKEINRVNKALAEQRESLKPKKSGWEGFKSSVNSSIGAVAAIGATIMGAVGSVKVFFNAWREQERAVQKVEQAIKSTGGAAGLSLKQLTDEATRLQGKTIFGDEEILNKSTAQLLTFTNIAGENFLKAQQAAMDLSTVLDGDLQGSSILLGKALNNPVEGLSRLRRVGIEFTADQIKTIKVLAETNRLSEAQGLILAEVSREYGGQAEAAAKGSAVWTQVGNQIGDVYEAIGKKMSSSLQGLGEGFRDLFKRIADGMADTSATEAFNNQVDAVINLKDNIDPLLTRYDDLKLKSKLSTDEQTELNSIIEKVADTVPGAVSAFDEYGKALGINTTKAREFINEQVAMMGVMNKNAIEEATKEMENTKMRLNLAKSELDKIMESGMITEERGTVKTGFYTTARKASNDEIKEAQFKYAELAKSKLGYETLIKNLNGDALKIEVERRQKVSEANKLAEEAKLRYKKMSLNELQRLADTEDELAVAEIERRKSTKETIKQLGDAFKELSTKISALDSQINDAIASRNTPLIQKLTLEKQAAEKLLVTYEAVKKAFAQGWSMDQTGLQEIGMLVSKTTGEVTSEGKPSSLLKKRESNSDAFGPTQDVKDQEAEAAKLRDNIKEAEWQTISTLNDSIFSMVQNRQQAEFDQKMSFLQKQREAELNNDKLTADQRNAIIDKFNKKESALKLAKFKQDQKTAITMAIVNGALAITKTFAEFGWPLGVPMAAAQAVATGLQIAVIKSQKPPEFFEGGFTNTSSDNRRPAGIVHDNEYVVPEAGLKNPRIRQILNNIEIARLKGSLPTLNPALLPTSGFAKGGYTSGSIFSAAEREAWESSIHKKRNGMTPMDTFQMSILLKLSDAVDKLQENGVHTNLSLFDLEKSQAKLANIRKGTEM